MTSIGTSVSEIAEYEQDMSDFVKSSIGGDDFHNATKLRPTNNAGTSLLHADSCECQELNKKPFDVSSLVDDSKDISLLEQNVFDSNIRVPAKQIKIDKIKCFCEPNLKELDLNKVDLSVFHKDIANQLEFGRDKLSRIDEMFSCQFLVGKNVKLNLCILRDETLLMRDRIIISLSAGSNEIHIPAREFLKKFIRKSNIIFSNGNKSDFNNEIEFRITYMVYGQCYKDGNHIWIVIRKYDNHHVVDRLYLCGQTWSDIKQTIPVIKKCYDLYLSYLVGGKTNALQQEGFTSLPLQVTTL